MFPLFFVHYCLHLYNFLNFLHLLCILSLQFVCLYVCVSVILSVSEQISSRKLFWIILRQNFPMQITAIYWVSTVSIYTSKKKFKFYGIHLYLTQTVCIYTKKVQCHCVSYLSDNMLYVYMYFWNFYILWFTL